MDMGTAQLRGLNTWRCTVHNLTDPSTPPGHSDHRQQYCEGGQVEWVGRLCGDSRPCWVLEVLTVAVGVVADPNHKSAAGLVPDI